jgi:hypothetical protein
LKDAREILYAIKKWGCALSLAHGYVAVPVNLVVDWHAVPDEQVNSAARGVNPVGMAALRGRT